MIRNKCHAYAAVIQLRPLNLIYCLNIIIKFINFHVKVFGYYGVFEMIYWKYGGAGWAKCFRNEEIKGSSSDKCIIYTSLFHKSTHKPSYS